MKSVTESTEQRPLPTGDAPRRRAWQRLAALLYRTRGIAPIPVGLVALVLTWRYQALPGIGGPRIDLSLDVIGVLLGFLGEGLRFYAAASSPTLDSQGRAFRASQLSTEGAYAWIRHPRYAGNALLILGLLCITNQPPTWIIGVPYFIFHTWIVAGAESIFLRRRFGAAYDTWACKVPAFVPRTLSLPAPSFRFDLRGPLRREIPPLAAWATAAIAFLAWERWAKGTLTNDAWLSAKIGFGIIFGMLFARKVLKWRSSSRHEARRAGVLIAEPHTPEKRVQSATPPQNVR